MMIGGLKAFTQSQVRTLGRILSRGLRRSGLCFKRMKLEPIIQSEVSQKDKEHYSILTHIYGIYKYGKDNPICKTEKETQKYRTDF